MTPNGNGVPTFGSNYLPWPNTQACADIIKVAGYNYGERMYAQAHHAEHPDWIIYGSETASVRHEPRRLPLPAVPSRCCPTTTSSVRAWATAAQAGARKALTSA